MSDLLFLGGNQLFDPTLLAGHRGSTILMVESDALCRRLPFHQQKIGLLLSDMREHCQILTRAGFPVRYFRLEDEVTVEEALTLTARQIEARRLLYYDSEDRALVKGLTRAAGRLDLPVIAEPSPMFLLDGEAIDEQLSGSSHPRIAAFYRSQRRRLGRAES